MGENNGHRKPLIENRAEGGSETQRVKMRKSKSVRGSRIENSRIENKCGNLIEQQVIHRVSP